MLDARNAGIDRLMTLDLAITIRRDIARDDRSTVMDTLSSDLADAPRTPAERRAAAAAVVMVKWRRPVGEYTTDEVAEIIKDIRAIARLGRTDRWRGAVETWATVVYLEHFDPSGGVDWALAQYGHYACMAA